MCLKALFLLKVLVFEGNSYMSVEKMKILDSHGKECD